MGYIKERLIPQMLNNNVLFAKWFIPVVPIRKEHPC